jgi:hypothetical protein
MFAATSKKAAPELWTLARKQGKLPLQQRTQGPKPGTTTKNSNYIKSYKTNIVLL